MKNKNLKVTSIALAVTAALFNQPVLAADDDSDKKKKKGLEVIEVTARKTVENLQEVPVTVTSISADDLQEAGISVITEVQQFSPNTTLQASRGTNSTLTAFIRGVGQQDPLWGYEPGVGIYIDDVYMARPQGAVLDLLDVERIEVLRGPQGTLYGKNTIGGAIKYVTKEMSGESEFNVQGTFGSYNQTDFKITGQIPLVDDKLYLGFGHAMLKRDGFGEFLKVASHLGNQDTENYNKDVTASRLTLEYRPTDDLFMRLAWDSTQDDSNSKGGYRLLPSLLTDAPVPDSVFDSYTSLPTENSVEMDGLSFTLDYTVSDALSLKYIAAKRDGYSDTNIDFDNTDLDIFDVPAIYDDSNTSHELQANYASENFKMVAGAYLYDGESCGHFDAILGVLGRALIPGVATGLTREVTGCNNSNSQAVYAQGSYKVNDKLSLTAGARYTQEEKDAYVNNGLQWLNVYPRSGWIPGYTRDPSITFPQVLGTDTNNDGTLDAPKTDDWSRFTPRIGAEYYLDDKTMLFASYSQGFKSGTYNPRASGQEDSANPEIVDSIEFGMKRDWNDQLRTNITVFNIDHTDRQYIIVTPDPNDATVLNQSLGNVEGSKVKGLEAEITYAASDVLSFDIAFGWLDAEIEEDSKIATPLVGLSNTPDMTLALAANYLIDSDYGYFNVNAGYYYRDDYRLFEDSDDLFQEGYGIVNVGVTWESNDGNWYGGIHGKNLTDEEYMVGGYNFAAQDDDGNWQPGLGGDTTLISYYGDPRTIHLTVGYRF